jgi:hypothetical protein
MDTAQKRLEQLEVFKSQLRGLEQLIVDLADTGENIQTAKSQQLTNGLLSMIVQQLLWIQERMLEKDNRRLTETGGR